MRLEQRARRCLPGREPLPGAGGNPASQSAPALPSPEWPAGMFGRCRCRGSGLGVPCSSGPGHCGPGKAPPHPVPLQKQLARTRTRLRGPRHRRPRLGLDTRGLTSVPKPCTDFGGTGTPEVSQQDLCDCGTRNPARANPRGAARGCVDSGPASRCLPRGRGGGQAGQRGARVSAECEVGGAETHTAPRTDTVPWGGLCTRRRRADLLPDTRVLKHSPPVPHNETRCERRGLCRHNERREDGAAPEQGGLRPRGWCPHKKMAWERDGHTGGRSGGPGGVGP